MQGLVTAHNTSSISVKIKLVCKRNHIMGLCPLILHLLQFVTKPFMAFINLILFFASAEYHINSGLEGTAEVILSNLFCPSCKAQQDKLGQVPPASGCSPTDALSQRNTSEPLAAVEDTVTLNAAQVWDKKVHALSPYELVS